MWDWWKKLLKRIKTDEKEMAEQVEPPKRYQRKHQIHTKVTYQYPSKAPFRFPVIPDEEDKRMLRSHSIKQNKRELLQKESHEPVQTEKNVHVHKKPFVPTPVASPIYGYGKREEEVETSPAFIRRRQEKDDTTQSTNRTSDIYVPFKSSLNKPFKRVNGATFPQTKAMETTQTHSAVENKVVHLKDYDAKINATLVPAEEEVSATLVDVDDSSVKADKQGVASKANNVIQENSSEKIVEQIHEESIVDNDELLKSEHGQEADELKDRFIDQVVETPTLEEEPEAVKENDITLPVDVTEQVEHKQEETIHIATEETHRDLNQTETKTDGQKRERPIPFNVVMTPQDKFFKKLQREQKKREEKRRRMSESRKDTYIPHHLLDDPVENSNEDVLWLKEQQELLEKTLKYFNVRASVVKVTQGPTVTRFEVQPELGVKVSKVRNLSDDIKLNMAAKDIRIEAPIPGKNTIGIEVPNLNAHMVGLQEIFETDDFKKNDSPLTIGLGLSVEGLPVISDIAKMPHGLIAGATGSGKSVCINTILLSILYKSNYKDVKLLLIDPKMVELAPYNGLPHLVSPVITDVKAATAALKWAVEEMEDRYERFVQEGVRDIGRYNQKIKEQLRHDEKMPYIVIVIDELADLMMASPQDVEDSICRIAQKARACGIHLLLATQRPSVDVITGLIKANVPTRIAFSVSSQVDSRTIIDMNGAERLLGKGDMLFIENGASKSIRLQGAFVSDEEIERITSFVRKIAPPKYLFEQEQLIQMEMNEDEDELLDEAIQFVLRQNHASTSLLQRQFRIGYNRAARLIDTLESRGIISGQNGSKPRDVLLSKTQVEDMYPS